MLFGSFFSRAFKLGKFDINCDNIVALDSVLSFSVNILVPVLALFISTTLSIGEVGLGARAEVITSARSSTTKHNRILWVIPLT